MPKKVDKFYDIDVSERVKELMDINKLTVANIADLLSIRHSSARGLIYNISPWRINQLVQIAFYFDITLDYLVFGEDNYLINLNKQLFSKLPGDIKDMMSKDPLFRFQYIKKVNLKTKIEEISLGKHKKS